MNNQKLTKLWQNLKNSPGYFTNDICYMHSVSWDEDKNREKDLQYIIANLKNDNDILYFLGAIINYNHKDKLPNNSLYYFFYKYCVTSLLAAKNDMLAKAFDEFTDLEEQQNSIVNFVEYRLYGMEWLRDLCLGSNFRGCSEVTFTLNIYIEEYQKIIKLANEKLFERVTKPNPLQNSL